MSYDHAAQLDLQLWQAKMSRRPSLGDALSKAVQTKLNKLIPEKAHRVITTAMKAMVRTVLFGAQHTTSKPMLFTSLRAAEEVVLQRIKFYRTTAAAEGGVTGAGGILLSLADFPILLSLKLKLLFEIAALYGYDVNDYKE